MTAALPSRQQAVVHILEEQVTKAHECKCELWFNLLAEDQKDGRGGSR